MIPSLSAYHFIGGVYFVGIFYAVSCYMMTASLCAKLIVTSAISYALWGVLRKGIALQAMFWLHILLLPCPAQTKFMKRIRGYLDGASESNVNINVTQGSGSSIITNINSSDESAVDTKMLHAFMNDVNDQSSVPISTTNPSDAHDFDYQSWLVEQVVHPDTLQKLADKNMHEYAHKLTNPDENRKCGNCGNNLHVLCIDTLCSSCRFSKDQTETLNRAAYPNEGKEFKKLLKARDKKPNKPIPIVKKLWNDTPEHTMSSQDLIHQYMLNQLNTNGSLKSVETYAKMLNKAEDIFEMHSPDTPMFRT